MMAVALLCLLAGCATPGIAPSAERAEPEEGKSGTPVSIVCVEGLRWSDITASKTPVLYSLVESGGAANLVTNNSWLFQLENVRPYVQLHQVPLLETGGLAEADAAVGTLLEASDPEGCFIVVATPAFARVQASPSLTPAIITGTGLTGYVSTSTTRRTGLIAGTDIEEYAYDLNSTWEQKEAAAENISPVTVEHPQPTPGVAIAATPAPPVPERLAFLEHNARICDAVDASKEAMDLAFLALFFITALFSVALLFFEIDMKPRHARWLVPLCRVLLLVAIAYPVSTFLMFLIPPALYALCDTPLGAVALCALWTLALTAAALSIGRKTRWVHSLFFLFIVTFAVIIADQLLAGPLTLTGYLNYQANSGVRYYGLGNEAAALLFGSWITFSGLVVNRFPKAKATPHFRRWGFPLASAAMIAVSVVPQIGASFGVLIWGIIGTVVAWWLFAERPLKLYFVAATAAASVLLAVAVLMADLAFNPFPHLDNLGGYTQGGPLALFAGVFTEVAAYSWATVVYSPALTALFVVVVCWMVVLALVKPGSYKEFWARNRGFRAVYTSGLAIMLLMCFIEDSGIFMPALYMAYLLAGFIWLVCDMHTWRSRLVAASGEHITLRELMRLAISQDSYRGGAK
jgi:hypothetical protein